jgi:hypothetical protein
LKSVEIAKTGEGKRVLSIKITGASSDVIITAAELRSILGYSVLKSTLFTIDSSQEGTFSFVGKGSGHGIGLCQFGAKGLAQDPYKYSCEKILSHYFPGTHISSLATLGVISKADAIDTKPTALLKNDIALNNLPNKARVTSSEPSMSRKIKLEVRVSPPQPL